MSILKQKKTSSLNQSIKIYIKLWLKKLYFYVIYNLSISVA